MHNIIDDWIIDSAEFSVIELELKNQIVTLNKYAVGLFETESE